MCHHYPTITDMACRWQEPESDPWPAPGHAGVQSAPGPCAPVSDPTALPAPSLYDLQPREMHPAQRLLWLCAWHQQDHRTQAPVPRVCGLWQGTMLPRVCGALCKAMKCRNVMIFCIELKCIHNHSKGTIHRSFQLNGRLTSIINIFPSLVTQASICK